MAATYTNTLAGSGVQPKFLEAGMFTVVATQAIASGATTATTYHLMNVASGVTILDVYLRLQTAISTATSVFNVGLTTTGTDFIASAAMNVATVAKASGSTPYRCTADQGVYMGITGGSTTQTGNVYVWVVCQNTEQID